MSEVTKPKSEGRVAAGKRLVEWNRKNKENLIKNKEKVSSSGEPSNLSSVQEPSNKTSSNLSSVKEPNNKASSNLAIYGGVVILVGVICAFYLHNRASPATTPSKNNDIFRMD